MTMSLRATWPLVLADPGRRAGSGPRVTIRSSIVYSPATIWLEHRLEVGRLGLGQEADLAEVDAEERDVDLGDGARGAQERAVAAEHDERVGRRQLARERVEVAGLAPAIARCRARGTSRRRASLSSTAASIVGL